MFVCDLSRFCQKPSTTDCDACWFSTVDDRKFRVGVEAIDSAWERRRILFFLGVVSARYDVSFRPCRDGLCSLSCFRPYVPATSMAIVCCRCSGSNFANLLKSFFFGCSCRSFVRSGVLVSNSEYNGTNFVAELTYSG